MTSIHKRELIWGYLKFLLFSYIMNITNWKPHDCIQWQPAFEKKRCFALIVDFYILRLFLVVFDCFWGLYSGSPVSFDSAKAAHMNWKLQVCIQGRPAWEKRALFCIDFRFLHFKILFSSLWLFLGAIFGPPVTLDSSKAAHMNWEPRPYMQGWPACQKNSSFWVDFQFLHFSIVFSSFWLFLGAIFGPPC